GSGVVIEIKAKLYELTNRHVIKDAEPADIVISLADGRDLSPVRVWEDAETDVAVMSVSAPGLVAARLGNSDLVEIGDFVVAVGSPFGLSHSVTYGIISAKGRRDLALGDDVALQDFLQTDAAINPGNSGGPLINLRGEVIGMNTAIASNSGGNEGIGFSIPINMVAKVARQLIEQGRVVRAFLGVNLDPKFTPAAAVKIGLPGRRGARINSLRSGSPAEAARLQAGDVILRFNGVRVDNDTHLIYLVNLTEVGKEVPIVVYRDGQSLHLTVKVGNKSDFSPATPPLPR
ncbi:MAG: trypsin-like peptidase domain-containing protein, partial [Pirellulales bacterium]